MKRLQGGELFGDDQRCVIGQHHATRADPDGGGGIGHVGNEDRRGGAGHRGDPMVLRHPEPVVAKPLDLCGQPSGVGQRPGRGRTRGHRGQIEDGQ